MMRSGSLDTDHLAAYREVMAVTRDALLVFDCKDYRVLDANPAACQLYGLAYTALVGSDYSALFSEPRYLADIVASHRDFVPLRFQRAGVGGHLPVELSLRYMALSGRECAVVAVRDVSERLERERGERESERKYQSLFEASPYPILMLTQRGMIVDANRCAELFYGYPHQAMNGLSWSVLEENGPGGSFLSYPAMLPTASHVRRDGSRFMAEVVLSYFRLHGQSMVLALVRDVSDYCAAVRSLQESEARWRFALEGHGDALIDWPVQGGQGEPFISASLSQMLGYEVAECADDSYDRWRLRVHPDDRAALERQVVAHLSGVLPDVQCEFRLRRADGEYWWVALRAKVIGAPGSGSRRLIGAVRDIHALRQRKLQDQVDRERMFRLERMAVAGEMLSALAHEVNQPLTAISNYSAVVQRQLAQGVASEQLQKSLAVINGQSLRAGEIVRRIREFVRRSQPNYVSTDLNALALRAMGWAEHQATAVGISLVADLAPDVPAIDLDVLQIEQVVFNLVRNAVESMTPLDPSAPAQVIVSTRRLPEHDQVELAVRDFGHGLPDGTSESIFEPFVSTKPGGMGMGLAICRTMVESHEGWIGASSIQGESGARFVVVLNRQRPDIGEG